MNPDNNEEIVQDPVAGKIYCQPCREYLKKANFTRHKQTTKHQMNLIKCQSKTVMGGTVSLPKQKETIDVLTAEEVEDILNDLPTDLLQKQLSSESGN